MRLLNVNTFEFKTLFKIEQDARKEEAKLRDVKLQDVKNKTPDYAMLSHVGGDEEIALQEFSNTPRFKFDELTTDHGIDKNGGAYKIANTCAQGSGSTLVLLTRPVVTSLASQSIP